MSSVEQHYSRPGLLARIDEVLRANGKDPNHLTSEDLAPVDQFHVGGKTATMEIAKASGIKADDRVLDVGGGLGGPARVVAQETGCHVTVLDLSEEFCQVGRELTKRCELASQIDFVNGTALDMPFEKNSFDVIWSQHSSMNIPEKPRLYSEIGRVLKPGGKYVLHEIFAGETQPVLYPAPWASREDYSFLISPQDSRKLLEAAGLRTADWRDTTDAALQWIVSRMKMQQTGNSQLLGIHLILGDVFRPAFSKLLRNFEEGRLRVVEAVLEKA